MKQLVLTLAIVLALVLPRSGVAQDGPEAAIQGVISDQVTAFLDRDVVTAFGFASPMIQSQFRNPQFFGQMVEQGYPMVWTPSETRFLDLREEGGALWQRVEMRDTEGRYHLLDYRMVEVEGLWRIDGVMMVRRAGIGV